MRAMVLAAGKGERMRPLTLHTPKPLLPVAGKPLLQWHLEALRAAGVSELVINHAWLGEQIERYFEDGKRLGVNIRWSAEGEPLETGGGIRKALPLLGDAPFILVNGDVWTDLDFSSIPSSLNGNDQAMLFLVDQPGWRDKGDFKLDGNRVQESDSPDLLYAGIALYHPSILDGAKVEKFSIVPRLKKAIQEDRVAGRKIVGEWDDVGTPERLSALREKHGE